MSFKRTKVVMLPTNQREGRISMGNTSLKLDYHMLPIEKGGIYINHTYQHLYFLSDDGIKEGDWCYDEYNKVVFQNNSSGTPGASKKIIATTDRLEISDEAFHNTFKQYLPQPSEGFILKFADSYNSGKPITEVNAEYEIDIILSSDPKFDLEPFEKLKVDPKDNTITIKKLKDTWTRDEVVTLILQSNLDSHVAREGEFDIMHWIAENL